MWPFKKRQCEPIKPEPEPCVLRTAKESLAWFKHNRDKVVTSRAECLNERIRESIFWGSEYRQTLKLDTPTPYGEYEYHRLKEECVEPLSHLGYAISTTYDVTDKAMIIKISWEEPMEDDITIGV